MDLEAHQLHAFFFPFMAQGHMIPIMDLAKLFAERGVKVGIITTPLNTAFFEKAIDRTRFSRQKIEIHALEFAPLRSIFPHGREILESDASLDMKMKFITSVSGLQKPLEGLVEEHRPDCIVADSFMPWTLDVSTKFNIPRLVFNGTSLFTLCIWESINRYAPHKNVASDKEAFVLPDLPHVVEITRAHILELSTRISQSGFPELWERAIESDRNSFGVVINTFHELEAAYVDHYRNVWGKKAWYVGPLSLCNHNSTEMADRGKTASISRDECLNWLDTKELSSVVYVSFGSLCKLDTPQLSEIAFALEESDHPFIWVVASSEERSGTEFLPDGFEERMKGKGLIIRGWAPQVLILNHPAIAAFVTHCGWNSILESVSAGVAMITWPMLGDQFYNDKLITQMLKIGVGVGAEAWSMGDPEMKTMIIEKQKIVKAITRLMADEDEAKTMRKKAREFGELAKSAFEVGGSSYADLSRLIDELRVHGHPC